MYKTILQNISNEANILVAMHGLYKNYESLYGTSIMIQYCPINIAKDPDAG